MHDGFKVTESVCIAKFEQQCVIAIMKIFENEPESRWLDEKIFYYYANFIFNTFNDRCTFCKRTSYIMPHLLRLISVNVPFQ